MIFIALDGVVDRLLEQLQGGRVFCQVEHIVHMGVNWVVEVEGVTIDVREGKVFLDGMLKDKGEHVFTFLV